MNSERDIVVYGSFNDYYVVFLEKGDAEYHAEIHRCHKEGITFGELHKRFPWLLDHVLTGFHHYKCPIIVSEYSLPNADEHDCDTYFDFLFELFCEEDGLNEKPQELDISGFKQYYENEMKINERFPVKNDVFNESYIDGSDFLDLLGYAPSMDWVPSEIREKYGEIHITVHDGEVLHFDISNTEKIVEAFEAMGFECVRDDLLVAKAYGQA